MSLYDQAAHVQKVLERVGRVQRQYTGLCVGGPYDGKYVTASTPVMALQKLTDAPPITPTPPDVTEVTVALEVFSYRHVEESFPCSPGTRGMPKRFSFWVPYDKDFAWALERLVQTFVANGGCVDADALSTKRS